MAELVQDVARWGMNLSETEETDSWATEWEECVRSGGVWGGRSRGGRGVRNTTGMTKDISVDGVSLEFCGKTLIEHSSLRLLQGHRYALIGQNGSGKSTLLRRIAKGTLAGIPTHFRPIYLQQELPTSSATVINYIMNQLDVSSTSMPCIGDVAKMRDELALLEQQLLSDDNEVVAAAAEQICILEEAIGSAEGRNTTDAASDSDQDASTCFTAADLETLPASITSILTSLGLTTPRKRLDTPLSALSGGWRMRVALARCLVLAITCKQPVLLLLDEATNHLDLEAVYWLQNFLSTLNCIMVIVSHDRCFIDAVATDIIHLHHRNLHYYAGNYSNYLATTAELHAHTTKAVTTLQKKTAQLLKNGSSGSTAKKIERAGMHRGIDGKKFKRFSLKFLDESYLRLPQTLAPVQSEKPHVIKLPQPPPLRLPTPTTPILSTTKLSVTYSSRVKPVLTEVVIQISLCSRIGIIGENGSGKSSLLSAIFKIATPGDTMSSTTIPTDLMLAGDCHAHHGITIGVVSQHHIDTLSSVLALTPLLYLRQLLTNSTATTGLTSRSSDLDLRAHLGMFCLSGNSALQPIGSLSGGEKARLSIAIACLHHPHLLLLDEPSNHMDIETLDALCAACRKFSGAVIVVSHNQHVLSSLCNEIWMVENHRVQVRHIVSEEGEEMQDAVGEVLGEYIAAHMKA